MSAIAELRQVSHRWPDQTGSSILGETWSIEEGEFALVIGASGSGKSSLLRCLNGLIPHFTGGAFSGVALIGGHDTRQHGPRTLSGITSFVFQDPESQSIAQRVDDDIAFGMEQQGVPAALMRKRVEECLDFVGLAHLRHRNPATLSGGERQRLAIAGALAMQPRLLVLDEPTSQLDPWSATDVCNVLDRLNSERGTTIAVSEHRLERLLPRADTVRVMQRGEPSITGTANEIAATVDSVPLPPVTQLGRALGVDAPPLSVRDARKMFSAFDAGTPTGISTQPAAGDDVVRMRRVGVNLDGHAVFRELDLTLREGEITALIGRNGSGKTTLLRTIAGLQPFRGRVETCGLDMGSHRPHDLGGRVGYVPQQPSSLFHEERLRDAMSQAGRVGAHDSVIETALARVGLHGLGDRHPQDLSGGERELAAIATVMMAKPRLLLLDEPTRGMDAWRKRDLAILLESLRLEGVCVVLVAHDMELVAACATRVVMLGDAGIVADATPAEVLGDSLSYTTQINAVFGGHYLTVADVLSARASSPLNASFCPTSGEGHSGSRLPGL